MPITQPIFLLKTIEVAVFLDVTQKTVANWAKTEKIASVNLGTDEEPDYRIPTFEVERYYAQLNKKSEVKENG